MSECFSLTSLYGKYLIRSITAAGLSPQTVDIDDKTTIRFWGAAPGSTPNSKPSLILIHGFGPSCLFQWRRQIVFFSPEFNLYVPDLVFFGESTTKSDERSENFQAICIAKLMEKLEVNDKYYVMGTSYGGFVAYHMALLFPEKVEKVIIASSGFNATKNDNDEFLKRANVEKTEDVMLPTTPSQLRTMFKISMFRRPYLPDFILNDIIQNFFIENRKEKLELLNGITFGKKDTVNLPPLRQEVLIIWGENDQVFLVENAYQLEKILGEKVKLQVIKKSSHLPQMEQPSQFNNAVKTFFSLS